MTTYVTSFTSSTARSCFHSSVNKNNNMALRAICKLTAYKELYALSQYAVCYRPSYRNNDQVTSH